MTRLPLSEEHAIGTRSRFEDSSVIGFVRESNRIEGLTHEPYSHELDAHIILWTRKRLDLADLEAFVYTVAGASLRRSPGQDVRVGPHVPPRGGSEIVVQLGEILHDAHSNVSPYTVHVDYETLHPFMDGNGRSGRALWAWMMLRQGCDPFGLGFLHRWYYDSLERGR